MLGYCKRNLTTVFGQFFEGGVIMVLPMRHICLIQKKQYYVKVKDFRPISLTTSLYKIIDKSRQAN